MKFLTFLVAFILSASASAGVKEEVIALGKLALGVKVHSARGKTPESLFKNYLKKATGEERELIFKEVGQMSHVDETHEGMTSLASAITMAGFVSSDLKDELRDLNDPKKETEIKKRLKSFDKNWEVLIIKLHQQAVKFGYTGQGPGYCGINFVELIVIDTKDQKIYEVYLSRFEDC
jgi:hypothetical protein